MGTLRARIEAVLPQVSRPSRYSGGEWNAVLKDHRQAGIKVAWIFPDTYEVGMSHLGSLIMYDQINRRADALCERAFAPWPDMEAKMREHGIPLFTLESHTPVGEFDILAFPLLYELTYTNVLTCLDLADLPLHAADRTDAHPLVIAGGPCAFHCEPLAPFLDVVVLGDGEAVIHEILAVVQASRGLGRRELLRRLAGVTGCYVPSFYDVAYNADGTVKRCTAMEQGVPAVVERATVADLDDVAFPTAPVVPTTDIVFDRAAVEVFRGCTRGCRFCHAGMVTRPVRERSPEAVRRMGREIIRSTGYTELSLTSLSTTDYTDISATLADLSRELQCEGVNVSLPSTRVDALSVELAGAVGQVRKTSVTLAPEGGSARMRRVINKTVSDDDIQAAYRAAFAAGHRALKLYFMIGLPTETDEDLAGIADKARWALRIADEMLPRSEARAVRVTVSTSVFVPKPHTPFQFEAQPEPAEVERRAAHLRRMFRDHRIEFKCHPPLVGHIEALLSLGDRRVAGAVLRAWQLGARFDGWADGFSHGRWVQACQEAGVDLAFYAHRRRPYHETLPWDHLSTGVTREWLVTDHQRAMAEEQVGDCRWDGCDLCGVCPGLGVETVLKGGGGGAA